MSFWDELEHFSRHEFPDPDKMDEDFMRRLDAYRAYIGSRIVVTFSTNGKHAKKSQHYLGLAVDFVAPDYKKGLYSLYLIAERFGFTGIGVYPDWHYLGRIVGGLHLDKREVDNYKQARWIGRSKVKTVDEKEVKYNEYFALDPDQLILNKVIRNGE